MKNAGQHCGPAHHCKPVSGPAQTTHRNGPPEPPHRNDTAGPLPERHHRASEAKGRPAGQLEPGNALRFRAPPVPALPVRAQFPVSVPTVPPPARPPGVVGKRQPLRQEKTHGVPVEAASQGRHRVNGQCAHRDAVGAAEPCLQLVCGSSP